MTHKYPECYFCGGRVIEKRVEFDYRKKREHLIFRNVPAGVCIQCGEKFFRPAISKKMDQIYDRKDFAARHIRIPIIQFKTA